MNELVLDISKALQEIRNVRRDALSITIGTEGRDALKDLINNINTKLRAGGYLVGHHYESPALDSEDGWREVGTILGIQAFYDPSVTTRFTIDRR